MALTVYKEPVDQPFARKRVIAFVVILSSSFLVPVMAFFIAMPLIVGGPEWYGTLYTSFVVIQAIDLILQIAHLVALFLLPKREEEEEIVERLKKFNLVTLMIWCFKCTNLPGPSEVHMAEIILGFAVPTVGCWIVLRLPHLFATKFPDGWDEDSKHSV